MIPEPSEPGAVDPITDYDDLDDGRGIIFWTCLAMSIAAFVIMGWLIYEITKAEPYAVAGREIRHYIGEDR